MAEILADACNLDIKNPSIRGEDFATALSIRSEALASSVANISERLTVFFQSPLWKRIEAAQSGPWRTLRLGELLEEVRVEEELQPDQRYRVLGVRLAGEGPYLRETKLGSEISATKLKRVAEGLFIYSRLFAWRGAFGIVPRELDGCYASNEFPTYRILTGVLPEFLRLYFTRPVVWQTVEKKCKGTTKTSRNRFKEEFLLAMQVSLPDGPIQQAIVDANAQAQALLKELGEFTRTFQGLPLDSMAAIYRGKL